MDGLRHRSAREVPGVCLRGPDSEDATLNLEVGSKPAGVIHLSLCLLEAGRPLRQQQGHLPVLLGGGMCLGGDVGPRWGRGALTLHPLCGLRGEGGEPALPRH